MKHSIKRVTQIAAIILAIPIGLWLLTIPDMHYASEEFVFAAPDRDNLYKCDDKTVVEIVTNAHSNGLIQITGLFADRKLINIKEIAYDEDSHTRSCAATIKTYFGKRAAWYAIIQREPHNQFVIGR